MRCELAPVARCFRARAPNPQPHPAPYPEQLPSKAPTHAPARLSMHRPNQQLSHQPPTISSYALALLPPHPPSSGNPPVNRLRSQLVLSRRSAANPRRTNPFASGRTTEHGRVGRPCKACSPHPCTHARCPETSMARPQHLPHPTHPTHAIHHRHAQRTSTLSISRRSPGPPTRPWVELPTCMLVRNSFTIHSRSAHSAHLVHQHDEAQVRQHGRVAARVGGAGHQQHVVGLHVCVGY